MKQYHFAAIYSSYIRNKLFYSFSDLFYFVEP